MGRGCWTGACTNRNIIGGPPEIIKVKRNTGSVYVAKFIGYRSRILFAALGNSDF